MADPSAIKHDSNLAALTRAMMEPAFYGDASSAMVEMRQTHISVVFLTGKFAYKVKKPVRFSFLDASALAHRYELCRDELRLNSRLTRDIYLSVVPIVMRAGRFTLGPACEAPVEGAIEYAVKMRRLDDDVMLNRRIASGGAAPTAIRAIAKRLADFHAACSRTKSLEYGAAAAVWRTVVGNLDETEGSIRAPADRVLFDQVDRFCRQALSAHWEMINERARAGRACEGHGDLRCEHVCLEGGRIDVIDCVEFSEALRYGDVALDIAFLAMDLDRLGTPELSREFVRAYAAIADDEQLFSLLPLYKCHRAIVRAKVAALKSIQPEIEAVERQRARQSAHSYLELAVRYSRATSPAIVVICGLSGTGKSTIAQALRLETGFALINSDRVRKRIAGIAETAHARSAYGEGIYSARSTEATYDQMLREAETSLANDEGAILDATYKDRAERRSVLELARRHSAPLLFVECRADENEVMRRLKDRAWRSGEVSDATMETYLQQVKEFMPLSEMPERSHVTVDSTEAPDRIVERIMARLMELQTTDADR